VRWQSLGSLGLALVVAAAAGALSACGGSGSTYAGSGALPTSGDDPRPPADAFRATVTRVVDGDTFLARRDGHALRVRLIGIDAPESVKPDAPVECYGPEASRVLHRLLGEGTRVWAAYEAGGEQDRFDRELWDVWLPDGRFLQATLVSRGAAVAHLYRPQREYADLLARLDDRARADRTGLWGRCTR
jgi:micrococcal nuclease